MGNFVAVENNGTAFAPKQCLHRRLAVGLDNPKIQSLSRCYKRTGRCGTANNPVSFSAYRAEIGNVGNFEAVESNVTAFAPKKCLHRKLPVDMKNTKMQSLSRCYERTGHCCRQITRFLAPRIGPRLEMWETLKLSKTSIPPLHQSNVYVKSYLSIWRTQNSIAFSVL